MKFAWPSELKKAGVLGINARNAKYISRLNPRNLYPLVDDKLKTKKLALAAGLHVPDLYATIEIQRQVDALSDILAPHNDFALKPAKGSGGEGIVVIENSLPRQKYRKSNGTILTLDELKFHTSNILSGMYSFGGHPDSAIIEYRVKVDPVFHEVCYFGVPDIRIIVFRGAPIMGMVRLPTRVSDGKANLHQGAIGAGVNIATGKTTGGVWGNDFIDEHPDTGATIEGRIIPQWDILLELSARCFEMTGLGYQGVDFVLDKELGPLILELNARPGLNIQIANDSGLDQRLKLADKLPLEALSPQERVDKAKELFG